MQYKSVASKDVRKAVHDSISWSTLQIKGERSLKGSKRKNISIADVITLNVKKLIIIIIIIKDLFK